MISWVAFGCLECFSVFCNHPFYVFIVFLFSSSFKHVSWHKAQCRKYCAITTKEFIFNPFFPPLQQAHGRLSNASTTGGLVRNWIYENLNGAETWSRRYCWALQTGIWWRKGLVRVLLLQLCVLGTQFITFVGVRVHRVSTVGKSWKCHCDWLLNSRWSFRVFSLSLVLF